MKFRIIKDKGVYWPEYKKGWFWRGIPVRMHTFDNYWVYRANTLGEAERAIETFKSVGNLSKQIIVWESE